jgi:protein associated with RNAse G/E
VVNLNQQVLIQALKYGDHLHYEWETTLLEKTDTHVFVLGKYGRELRHYTKGKTFTVENWTIEFFPLDSWFTVSADIIEGEITQYYCNICEPARMNGREVTFVDLDIDLVYRNGRWMVVDEDEFTVNALKFSYPPELIERVKKELKDLEQRIEQKQFPFDGSIEKFIEAVPKR